MMKATAAGRPGSEPLRRPMHRRFKNMHGKIRYDRGEMHWPTEQEAQGRIFNGNNLYRDLRGTTWSEVEDVLERETQAIDAWEQAGGWSARGSLLSMVNEWSLENDGMDLGITAATYAIAAAGGVPTTSCNGGAFGGWHLDHLPAIGFWWRTSALKPLIASVEKAGMSTWMAERGVMVLGGDYIRRYLIFTAALQTHRAFFEGRLDA